MKKLTSIAMLILCTISLQAQVYLVDALKPTESFKVNMCASNVDKMSSSGQPISQIYVSNSSFNIKGGQHGLIGNDEHGWITYNLEGKYSKLSFWAGPANNGGSQSKAILTVQLDGRRVIDQVIFSYAQPQFYTLDVTDVDELKMKVLVGEIDIAIVYPQLWKEGAEVKKPALYTPLPEGKIELVKQLKPYYTTSGSYVCPIQDKNDIPKGYQVTYPNTDESITMSLHEFKSGIRFTSSEQLAGSRKDFTYFWLDKRYDKISFIFGPRDNKSSNSTAWLIVYGDKQKILYEGIVTQKDLPRQVVIDVAGQDRIGFAVELRSTDFLGSITFGTVDIFAYPKGDTSVPKEGLANINKEKVSKLKSPCSLMTNFLPYSVRGVAKASSTLFTGESSHITFSMGGEKFSEGLILAAGTTLFDDKIDAYATFDLAEEFDYLSFYAGALTNRRVLDDDRLLVYADDKLILDTMIHCTWVNQYFELPLNKCRSLRFAKPSSGKQKQVYIGIGDIALYRGKPVKNNLFYHEKPECPDEADLIDLCERPYFHYVGRYLSTLTDFDFNDCFKNGTTQREFFQMKDGSKIYKGVMLEANVPLGLEDITLTDAIMMFFVGAGSAISSSNVSAYTGITAGGGLTGQMAIARLMNNQNNGQASVVAFNPYGEYQSCTFTIANKSEYWDEMSKLLNLGERVDHPYKLNVFADQRLVAEIWVKNRMEPTTYTVPIFNCHSLMFWLEPGEYRSGQFVLYDMKVSKDAVDIPIPDHITTTEELQKSNEEKEQVSEVSAQQENQKNSEETKNSENSEIQEADNSAELYTPVYNRPIIRR